MSNAAVRIVVFTERKCRCFAPDHATLLQQKVLLRFFQKNKAGIFAPESAKRTFLCLIALSLSLGLCMYMIDKIEMGKSLLLSTLNTAVTYVLPPEMSQEEKVEHGEASLSYKSQS